MFGSRATGNAKEYSDLDLAIMGEEPLSLREVSALDEALGESDLPFKVDIVEWARIDEGFRRIIRGHGVVVQVPEGKPKTTGSGNRSTLTGSSLGGSHSGWRRVPLGDFVTLQRGHDLPAAVRSPGNTPILGSFGITGWHDESRAAGPGVTVGRSGASFGVVSYSPVDYWPLNTALYVTDFHGNDQRFAYYFLKHFDFRSFNSGSAQPSLNRNFIHPVHVDVPPLPDQRAIAHVLGALDDKIELNRRMNETLEAMARALFKSWFVDFDPVRAKMDGRGTGLPQDIADLFPDRLVDSEMGEIPEGWEATSLGTVIEIHDRKRIPLNKRQRAERQGPYPYYGAAGIMDYVNDFLFDGVYILTGEDGSVVDAHGHPVVQYVWGKFWVNNHAHVLKGRKDISDEHLYLLLQRANITAFVTGAVQPKLNQKNLKAIPLVLPTGPACRVFSGLVAPLFARVRHNADESERLVALRDALLPKLISGEIRVQYAETVLESVT